MVASLTPLRATSGGKSARIIWAFNSEGILTSSSKLKMRSISATTFIFSTTGKWGVPMDRATPTPGFRENSSWWMGMSSSGCSITGGSGTISSKTSLGDASGGSKAGGGGKAICMVRYSTISLSASSSVCVSGITKNKPEDIRRDPIAARHRMTFFLVCGNPSSTTSWWLN